MKNLHDSLIESAQAVLEGANPKSVVSELKKKLALLNGDMKGGNTNDIITRLESIGIFIDKSVKDLKKSL